MTVQPHPDPATPPRPVPLGYRRADPGAPLEEDPRMAPRVLAIFSDAAGEPDAEEDAR
jgi:hypothetical protein